MAHAPRNTALIPGVSKLSRSQSYKAKALFNKKKSKPVKAAAKAATKVVAVGGAKNGNAREVSVVKAPKYYPAEDAPKPKVTRKTTRPAPLRSSITPGTVLILVAGRYAGKRVVFLKRLASGLLLVSGPFKVNGVPLRRVNQAYVIATSVKVDLAKVKVDEKINDAYFKADKAAKKKATEEALFDATTVSDPLDFFPSEAGYERESGEVDTGEIDGTIFSVYGGLLKPEALIENYQIMWN
jgi:large subunit ribosomal protein L6e